MGIQPIEPVVPLAQHRQVSIATTFALALLLVAGCGLAHAGPASFKSCEVRPGCTIFVPQPSECSAIITWRGKCERGHVQGVGALHFVHGYALVGRYAEGRAQGQVVWHENGIPKGIGEYETQLLSLGANGVEQGNVVDCTWDFDRQKVVSADKGDKRCETAAKNLGELSFSPDLWRAYAKQSSQGQLVPGAMIPSIGKRLP